MIKHDYYWSNNHLEESKQHHQVISLSGTYKPRLHVLCLHSNNVTYDIDRAGNGHLWSTMEQICLPSTIVGFFLDIPYGTLATDRLQRQK